MFDNILQKIFPNNALNVTICLNAIEVARLNKAITFNGGDTGNFEDLGSHMSDACMVYDDFIRTTIEQDGLYLKSWDHGKYEVPVMDFASDAKSMHLSIYFENKDQLDQLHEVMALAEMDSVKDTVRRAIGFFSNMIIEEHYGWVHTRFDSSDPDGEGEPIFDYELDSRGQAKIVRISDYLPDRSKIVASLDLLG